MLQEKQSPAPSHPTATGQSSGHKFSGHRVQMLRSSNPMQRSRRKQCGCRFPGEVVRPSIRTLGNGKPPRIRQPEDADCVAKPSLAGVTVREDKGTAKKRYDAQLELITDCEEPKRFNLRYLSKLRARTGPKLFGLSWSYRTARCPSDAEETE